MQTDTESSIHPSSWDRLAALEKELEATRAFNDIHHDNYHLVSKEYETIVVQACAEIEKIYQHLSGKALAVKRNISDYIASITNHCKDFFDTEIHLHTHNGFIKPWGACSNGADPEFWSVYHAIKHQGEEGKATLQHAIHSLAGLFSLLLAYD